MNLLSKLRRRLRPRTRWLSFRQTPRVCRQQFRYALRQALMPEWVLPVDVTALSGTRFHLSADPIDDSVFQEIVTRPERLFPDLDEWAKRDGVIVDIGGHHGLYASEALRRYPLRELVVMEPHPDWCRLIERNAALNDGANRTRIVKACLAADREKQQLRFDPNSSWGATVHPSGKGAVMVEVESLPLVEVLNGQRPLMLYCNAEGAEYLLPRQLELLSEKPRVLVIELHPEYGDAEKFRAGLRRLGYFETDHSAGPKRPLYHYTLKT